MQSSEKQVANNPKVKAARKKMRVAGSMLLLAIISITTATYAWFTVSTTAVVDTLSMEVSTGQQMKISTEFFGSEANDIEKYFSLVENDPVSTQLAEVRRYGDDAGLNDSQNPIAYPDGLEDYMLEPVTSGNGRDFYTRGQNEGTKEITYKTKVYPGSGKYLPLTLWFLSTQDCDVRLDFTDSDNAEDATAIMSSSDNTAKQEDVIYATRLSFTAFKTLNDEFSADEDDYDNMNDDEDLQTFIFEPNSDDSNTADWESGTRAADDAGDTVQNTFIQSDEQNLFSLTAYVPTKVVVNIWLEGEDPECIDDISHAKVDIRLKFSAYDVDGNLLS